MKLAEISVGENRIVVEDKHLTFAVIEELANGYVDVKAEYSLFTRFPIQDNETTEEWAERVLPLLDKENAKSKDESSKQYLERIQSPKFDKQKVLFDSLKLVAKVTGQESKIVEDSLKQVSYPALKEFLKKVFESCDLSVKDFE